MESIKNWFQDWSDACEYAKECAPDLSFAVPAEPYSALVVIAAGCLAIWWWNERKLKPTGTLAASVAKSEIRAIRSGELAPKLGWARSLESTPDKKAA